MLHGQKKTKKVKSQAEIKEQTKLSDKINKKLSEFFSLNRTTVQSSLLPKYLQFTALLMQLCSDIPTIFNFRRQLISQQLLHQGEDKAQVLGRQLKMSTKLIQSDPKCYTLWSYRQWLVLSLNELGGDVVKNEKDLVKMLLMKDEKNFHAWNYRNWLNSVRLSVDQELAFTKDKIKSNPFNFSPYHFRSKLLGLKYSQILKQEHNQDIVVYGMPREVLDQQIETVRTAIFLNPSEEAPWLYYKWLLSQLVPAFVVAKQPINQHQWQLLFNIKVGDFSALIKGSNPTLKTQGNNLSQKWLVQAESSINVKSNLQTYSQVMLVESGRCFMGEAVDFTLLANIKKILRGELQFVQQVIASEESQGKKCRFGALHLASVCQYLLLCGSSCDGLNELVNKSLQGLKVIAGQGKAGKFVMKQIENWQRLSRNQLNQVERALLSIM